MTTNLSYGEPLDQLQGRSRTKELAKRSAVSATEKELKVHANMHRQVDSSKGAARPNTVAGI